MKKLIKIKQAERKSGKTEKDCSNLEFFEYRHHQLGNSV